MLKYQDNNSSCNIAIFLLPDFSMIAFTNVIETLRLANKIGGKTVYKWTLISRDGQAVNSSAGLEIAVQKSILQMDGPDNVILCSGDEAYNYQDGLSFGVIRRWAREGAHIGSIDSSTHILANAGVLNGYECTTHWSNIAGFNENHPEIDAQPKLFTVDRKRFSCAGGTAAIDMMLSEVSNKCGEEIAVSISEQMLHERIRSGNDRQKIPLQARFRASHPKLVAAIKIMEENMEEPLSLDEIGKDIGMSRRQLERLFSRYLEVSPGRHYMKTRLEHAQDLLRQTAVPVTEVAFACGFSSASHFSKAHKEMYDCTPLSARTGNIKTSKSIETSKIIGIQLPLSHAATIASKTMVDPIWATA